MLPAVAVPSVSAVAAVPVSAPRAVTVLTLIAFEVEASVISDPAAEAIVTAPPLVTAIVLPALSAPAEI